MNPGDRTLRNDRYYVDGVDRTLELAYQRLSFAVQELRQVSTAYREGDLRDLHHCDTCRCAQWVTPLHKMIYDIQR